MQIKITFSLEYGILWEYIGNNMKILNIVNDIKMLRFIHICKSKTNHYNIKQARESDATNNKSNTIKLNLWHFIMV